MEKCEVATDCFESEEEICAEGVSGTVTTGGVISVL